MPISSPTWEDSTETLQWDDTTEALQWGDTFPEDTLPTPVETPPSPPEPEDTAEGRVLAKELESFDPQATAIPGLRVPATPMESFLDLPRADIPAQLFPGQKTPNPLQVVGGVYNTLKGVTEAIASPAGAASAVVAAAVPPAAPIISGTWAGEMARHVPEAVVDAYGSVVLEEPLQEQVEKIGNVAALGLGTVAAGTHAGRALVKSSPTARAFEAEPAAPPVSPDIIARNLAAPGTVRPTEQSAFGPPEAERPPEMVQFERVPIFNQAGEVVDVQVQPIMGRRLILPVRNAAGEIIAARPQIAFPPEAARIIEPPPSRGNVRSAPEGGRLSKGAQAFSGLEATPGFAQTAEQRIIAKDSPMRPSDKIVEPAESPEVRSVDDLVRDRLRRRDLQSAVDAVAAQPANVQRKVVESILGVGREPVPLEAGWQTIFNNIWERAVEQSRERPAPTRSEPTAPAVEAAPAPAPEPVAKPGLVSGTAAEAWADRVIASDPRTKTRVTLDPLDVERFAAYVVKGAALLERGVTKFSEWSVKMIAEHGDAIRPHLKRIFDEASTGLKHAVSDDGALKQRKLATRGSVSPEVPEVHQERLKTGREAFYEPQEVARVEDTVAHLTSEELASVPVLQADGPANLWTAAQLELYRRNVASGKLDAAWDVMEKAMKTGTSLGQLVNQFKMLRGATPDGILVAINRRLANGGFDPMKPSEQIRTRRLSEQSIKDNVVWKESERIYRDNPSPENYEKVTKAREDAIESDAMLQEKIQQYQPRAFWDLMTTLLKGNLLAPISQFANVAGNTTNLAIRGISRSGASVVSAIDAFLRNTPRKVATSPIRGSKETAKAVVRALPESLKILWKGSSDLELSKSDVYRTLKPMMAMRDFFLSQVQGPQRNGKTPFSQRMLMALEASPFAMHATAQLRLLGAVDAPFRSAARARLITEAMKLGDPRSYTSEKVSQAVKYPELFLDAATLDRIDAESAYAVYQNRGPVSQTIQRALANAKPSTRFMVATIAPYITTPVNVIGEWFSYNPAIAGINTIRHAVKGNPRQAQIAAGKFVAGSMMLAAGYWMYQKGLITPTLSQSDEQQKARILAGMTMPPNHINLSGLDRARKGEDPTWKPGDRTVDVLRGGGVAGSLMLSITDIMRRRERQPEAEGSDFALRTAGDQWTQMLQYGVNQSFLKGTANLLDAIQEGKVDSWTAQYVDGLTSIALPGTMNALARSTREFKPEVRGDSLDERLENQLRSRLGVFGADDKLPLKRDLWGRPIKETPEGNLPWLYQTIDVSKAQKIPQDDVALMLYGLWRRTGNSSVIPTPPDASIVIRGRKYQIEKEDLSRLQELVGTERHRLAERFLLNPNFLNKPLDAKVDLLSKVWSAGARRGTIQFWKERGATLEPKESPAGFQTP